jgi:hopanoid biosynthesis associated protein HpnK
MHTQVNETSAAGAARRLIVNADDFGRSRGINAAVIRAHREGILTTASLMVNEAAGDEAVALARENPRLGVGLHLTLVCGRSALPAETIPGLVNGEGKFNDCPVATGFRYYADRRLTAQLEREMAAQFEKFAATALPLDHVNGHLHLHLHPVVFGILMRNADRWRIRRTRLTCEPFWLNTRLAGGRWLYRASHAAIYRLRSRNARPRLREKNIKHTQAVFGLLQNAGVDEAYLARLLPVLPAGDSELYSHPSLDQYPHEFEALVSPRVKALVEALDIKLIRYQDL